MIDGFAYNDDPVLQAALLPVLRNLCPVRVAGVRKLRVGNSKGDGGYVMIDDFQGIEAAYSYGINNDVTWDKDIAARNIPVYQYDHTIMELPETNPLFNWTKQGICGHGSEEPNLRTLSEHVERNGHTAADRLLLKIDVEGAEWDVFSTLPPNLLSKFDQVVGEFHGFQHFELPYWAEKLSRSIANITAGHRLFHVHANNNSALSIVGGIPLPAVLELSFARITQGREMIASDEIFPTDLDFPCFPGRADYRLGTFKF